MLVRDVNDGGSPTGWIRSRHHSTKHTALSAQHSTGGRYNFAWPHHVSQSPAPANNEVDRCFGIRCWNTCNQARGPVCLSELLIAAGHMHHQHRLTRYCLSRAATSPTSSQAGGTAKASVAAARAGRRASTAPVAATVQVAGRQPQMGPPQAHCPQTRAHQACQGKGGRVPECPLRTTPGSVWGRKGKQVLQPGTRFQLSSRQTGRVIEGRALTLPP